MALLKGKAWVFGDDIDTDVLAPSAYLRLSAEEIAKHCLEAVEPDFAMSVSAGDIFVAGENLGIGSSREQAPQVLQLLGIKLVLAKSISRIFYRNALNLGLATLLCPEMKTISTGDNLSIDPLLGLVRNLDTQETMRCEPIPDHLMEMLSDGGLLPHLEKKLANLDKP